MKVIYYSWSTEAGSGIGQNYNYDFAPPLLGKERYLVYGSCSGGALSLINNFIHAAQVVVRLRGGAGGTGPLIQAATLNPAPFALPFPGEFIFNSDTGFAGEVQLVTNIININLFVKPFAFDPAGGLIDMNWSLTLGIAFL